jgi:hypothetical protein
MKDVPSAVSSSHATVVPPTGSPIAQIGQKTSVVGQRSKYSICPHINTFIRNTTRVEEALDRVYHFHDRGGALQSMISYQDTNMKQVFAENNLTFDKKESGHLLYGKEAHDFIRKYMADSANPRGGYFSTLPGHFPNTSSININHIDFQDKKVRTVQEPNSEERWMAGMGPIGPECDNLLELGDGFESKVGSYGSGQCERYCLYHVSLSSQHTYFLLSVHVSTPRRTQREGRLSHNVDRIKRSMAIRKGGHS